MSRISSDTYMLKIALLVGALSLPAFALDGYVFAAPGATTISGFSRGTLHFGGGVEQRIGQRFGLGGELGALGNWNNFRGAIGIASANAYYHLGDRSSAFDPFITGGYSLGFRTSTINMLNMGAGANYWFSDRLGFRAEFRDHLNPRTGPNLHYWGIRLGLSFR
jgi:hypothetical protein